MVLTLKNKEHLIDNVWAFRFEPSEPLTWIAGQFIRVELPRDAPDGQGTKRWFTVSSAPYEGIMQITTRVTDSTFKQDLAALKVGDDLQLLDKPAGDFVWEASDMPVVFIAGGIGVTPFYSIIKQRAHQRLPLNVSLIYGSRTADVPFKTEFNQWAKNDPSFRIYYIPDQPLTVENLTELQPGLMDSLVYLSGPEPLVETLGDQLKAHGLAPQQLKQDFFPNYTEANY
ncbi:MAG: ferredoxin--NADP reductase [Candidatus Saccharibacteria bacterium]